ncbi:beta-galactoside alpha-2,6-sialyltransferase 2-like [Branchiostoma floridae]|uniref:beta-galactoside alpha-(2,6)-sialyltransferase n=1 Tax=Branchiostoma floridae TaxID=7739 RepID=A0A9J7M7V8_BRAFL|nr:beta-galactoside alpha-2,6-sialyltransferase 2-like [Branchiostoma floridae]
MAKRTLLRLAAGLLICVVIYGILPKSLRTRSVLKAYKAMGGKRTQLSMLRNTKYMNSRELPKLRQEMSCKLKKKVPFSTITRKQAPQDKNKDVLPEESLEKLVHFNSCAVVSSSHALRFHSYGQEIDSHDAVLRFNCAPTHKFEQFVGNRTDFRLINTQIPHRYCTEEFWSENSTIFRHGTLVIRNMNAINLQRQKINNKRDKFRCFDNLIKYKKTYPNRALPFIQRPLFGNGVLAELVEFCKSTNMCDTKMRPNLSSGILGVVMMMHLCNLVYVYELVPSNKDDTEVMYYFNEEKQHDWHPYSHERVYIRTLSLTPEKVIEDTGVVVLGGFSQTQC